MDDFKRPWNARSEAKGLAPGIPREILWAKDSTGINQIGCVYTAQGFEFDYVGIIWGKDLVYDFDRNSWVGQRAESHDSVVRRSGDRFIELVKNTYRVLLSRGMKGCYVYFLDRETERFVRSRTEGLDSAGRRPRPASVPTPRVSLEAAVEILPFKKIDKSNIRPYENCVPLLDLKIAAGTFSEEQQLQDVNTWVELPAEFRPQKGLFVCQVVGESMNRRIPNGAWCLFRVAGGGTRQGKVVIASHREISDSDTGGHYTIKVYHSKKIQLPDGTWRHEEIVLKPDSSAPGYLPIVLDEKDADDLQVIAELVAVLD